MNETIFEDSVFFDSLIIIDPYVCMYIYIYIYPQYIPSELNQHSVDSYDVPMIDG